MNRASILLVLAVAACTIEQRPPTQRPPVASTGDTLRAPDGSVPPAGALGRSILRGHALLAATRDSLPDHVGNALRCTSCHIDDGRRKDALPFIGVYAKFPQYRPRAGTVQRLEDRINDCFLRSMNGKAFALEDPTMRDIVAYIAFMSRGTLIGGDASSQGLSLGTETHGDTAAGAVVFTRECARCHGANGEGTAVATPVWGSQSFNIGAGMARLRSAAAFIRHNMPYDKPGSLSEADVVNVAAYITSRPRPDFAAKELDWPNGDPPADVAYPTKAGRKR